MTKEETLQLELLLEKQASEFTTNNTVKSIKAILILFIVSFILDLLCNQFEFLFRYTILSYGLTLVSILAICYKSFDYVLSEIDFFENWKGTQYEVPAKAFIVGVVLWCITILLQSAGSTDTSKASPAPPSRIEIVNKTPNSSASIDSLESESKRATER